MKDTSKRYLNINQLLSIFHVEAVNISKLKSHSRVSTSTSRLLLVKNLTESFFVIV